MEIYKDHDISYPVDHPASVSVLIQTNLEGAEQVVRDGVYALVITGDEHRADASFYGTTNDICAIGIIEALEELKKKLIEQHPLAGAMSLLKMAMDHEDTALVSELREIIDHIMQEDEADE